MNSSLIALSNNKNVCNVQKTFITILPVEVSTLAAYTDEPHQR